MAEAGRLRTVTPDLRAAFADPAVAFAGRYEMVAVGLVIVLMVLKPI